MFGHSAFAETAFAEIPSSGAMALLVLAGADVAFVGAGVVNGVLSASGTATVTWSSGGSVFEARGLGEAAFVGLTLAKGVFAATGGGTFTAVGVPQIMLGTRMLGRHRGTVEMVGAHSSIVRMTG